jgi:hypothetical protein
MKDPDQKEKIVSAICEYVYWDYTSNMQQIDLLLQSDILKNQAQEYVENQIIPNKTIDLVILKWEGDSKEILVSHREMYPAWLALPGWFLIDTDESNSDNIPAYIYASLRIAGSKVLPWNKFIYGVNFEEKYYFIKDDLESEVRIAFRNANGYRFTDNLTYMTVPSDPRHMVDTVGVQCELIGNSSDKYLVWRPKKDILDQNIEKWWFIFWHHREIVAHLWARNPALSLEYAKHHEWMQSLIRNPEEAYEKISNAFKSTDGSINTSIPELAPIVKKILDNLLSPGINDLCKADPTLKGIRDKTIISLRHCMLWNRNFCPYLPTLEAIMKGITFFDIAARVKKWFYNDIPVDGLYEHNPRVKPYASYHMYRYEYRWNEIKGMIPNQIIIPTFEPLGATDIMKIRGVPIHFVWLSTEFTYVDEFEQSPEEFFMHDVNHSYRMILETEKYIKIKWLSHDQFIEESNKFIREFLGNIKILSTDIEEQKELKKLKKIIVFEVVHEDARVFMRDSIIEALQVKEGWPVPFEVPHINPEWWMEMVDTLDNWISPLSYVRNKLQHGFYDKIDTQIMQIVHQKYRTSDWIARAAYEVLKDLWATPQINVDTDKYWNVSYDWLIARTCSVGPDNIHISPIEDPAFKRFHDGNTAVNPKRYQA